MSHPENTKYLEDVHERFFSNTSGFERCTILRELKERGFSHQAEILVGEWYIERHQYLEENGIEEDEILNDADDPTRQYVTFEEEMGTPGDDYQITKKSVDIPEHLNVDYWLYYNTK